MHCNGVHTGVCGVNYSNITDRKIPSFFLKKLSLASSVVYVECQCPDHMNVHEDYISSCTLQLHSMFQRDVPPRLTSLNLSY